MIRRINQSKIIEDLKCWAEKKDRKPLILRGARQVGKTTAVDMFAQEFNQYLYLNLDIKEDRALFKKEYAIDDLVSALFFLKNKQRGSGRILIFIDEIQNSPEAVAMLRYFYESAKKFWVIAAGSLLEPLIGQHISFPVGRVEYLYMKPLTFNEYVEALREISSTEALSKVPCPAFAHSKLLKLFYQYTLLGGMPEVVATYIKTQDIQALNMIYESLLRSYLEDIEKYESHKSLIAVMRHAMENSFYAAGSRIHFEGFGQSRYKSREMGEALKTIERAMLIYLIYPTTAVTLPAEPDFKKSPRLHFLDTGLVNYFVGLQKDIFGTQNLNAVYEGKIAEHIVGQELLAENIELNNKVQFWVRHKKQSNAEVDYVIRFEDYLIPVEVKIGAVGRLRSLHEFMDRTPHMWAVRIYSGELRVDHVKTIKGKDFFLLNLPFYLTSQIKLYLDWMIKNAL